MSKALSIVTLGFALIIGLLVALAIMHVNVTSNGGYSDPSAVLFMVGAVMVVGGPFLVGLLWNEEGMGRALGFIIVAVLVVEGASMIATAKSKLDLLAAKGGPAETAERDRALLKQRIERLRAERTNLPSISPAVRSASDRVGRAEAAIAEQAAKRGCARNCRALLSKQLDDAQAALRSAQSRFAERRASLRADLDGKIATAEAQLAAIEVPTSGNSLIAALGVSANAVAAVQAALIGFGVNLFVAGCMGIAGGLLRGLFGAPEQLEQAVKCVALETSPKATTARKPARAARGSRSKPKALPAPEQEDLKHVVQFLDARMKRDPDGSVPLITIGRQYHDWCDATASERMDQERFGLALKQMLSHAGASVVDRNGEPIIQGIRLAA
ncbi:MAG: hypothetical protein AAFV69_08705 [Pseudomonadota bacterium]